MWITAREPQTSDVAATIQCYCIHDCGEFNVIRYTFYIDSAYRYSITDTVSAKLT
jgi:hypothetical protein